MVIDRGKLTGGGICRGDSPVGNPPHFIVEAASETWPNLRVKLNPYMVFSARVLLTDGRYAKD